MHCPLCETCGTQFAPSTEPPAHCPICEDERQYVGWTGQRWTTHEELARRFTLRLEEDDGVLGIGTDGTFAISQRALWLPTDAGHILWECVSLVTPDAVEALKLRGGVDRIVISHPHFYSAMVEWSEALGGVPILLHEADREWVQRPTERIEFWRGDSLRLSDGVTLIRCGGHFEGSTALHWAGGAQGRGALFPGDALQVTADRRHVAFMYSYPNYMPMKPSAVRAMRDRLSGFDFDTVHGYTWGRNIIGGGREAVDRSFDRYLDAVTD
jgi:glyoxylase-like metal-dependent hydrolase (beta-lactamase superfamily II)